MRRAPVAVALLVSLLAAGCGKGGGGTTIVVTTAPAASPTALIPYRVPSGSMEPTIALGEYVYAERRTNGPLHLGDIIIFHPPEGAEKEECGPSPHTITLGGEACSQPIATESSVEFIKRVVAGPGEEMYVKDGHVYRRATSTGPFVREPDSYIRACGASPECDFPKPITIPGGDWFTMGDNRGESDDSRFWGPIPLTWVVGIVRYCSQRRTPCPGT